MSYSVFVAGYGRTFAVRAAVRIIPSHEKWPTEADPSFRPAIYASAYRIVQPPDDRTYSAEVTVLRRNLPHHRSARAVFPYTRPIMIPSRRQFVKCKFRRNHKVFPKNSAFFRKSQPRRHPAPHTDELLFGGRRPSGQLTVDSGQLRSPFGTIGKTNCAYRLKSANRQIGV